jgi:signal transduction histidine kinase/FixJ family two-component response regulator
MGQSKDGKNQAVTATILLVEDEVFFRQLIADPLRAAGYTVIEAASGAEVPALLLRHDLSAVLTDLEMPGISGLEVLKQVRGLDPDLPVVVISGHQDFVLAREVLRAGALDYLVKPFNDGELLESAARAVAACADNRTAHRNRESAQRRLSDLVLLREIAETASGTVDLQCLFELILDTVVSAVQVQTASLMLPGDDGYLTIRASRGLPPGVAEHVRIAPGEGVSGHVFESGEPVLLADIEQDGRFTPAGDDGQYSTRSALSLPLKGRGGVLGVLNVNNKADGAIFSAADRNLLDSVVYQATLAMENFQLVNRLQEKARQLELMNRTRSRMVCNLSHELRTPLTAILGFSELILQCRPMISEDELAEYLEKILDGSTQMERLINGMLLLFSLDSGTAYWQIESIDLSVALQQGLHDLAPGIAQKKLQVDMALPPGQFQIAGDSDKTPVALSSLLDNAVKFNRVGGRIVISAEVVDGKVFLRIFNDGASVPASSADAIFAPYNQLGEINVDKPAGVGIGLSLCRTIIEHAGGRINLDETNGEGTAFILELPQWDAAVHVKEV